MEIIPNVHLIPNIVANPYLLIDPDGLTLIDAGLPGSHRKILRYLAGLGYAPGDLKRILITHADFDHVGGLAPLKAATGARVFASPAEAQAMAEGHASRPLKPRSAITRLLFDLMAGLFKPAPVKVDEMLVDGQIFPVLGGLRVVETPGHTPDIFRCLPLPPGSCSAAIRSSRGRLDCAVPPAPITGTRRNRTSPSASRPPWVCASCVPGMARS